MPVSTAFDRRSFMRTLAAATVATALPGAAPAFGATRLKVGHTGITWGFRPADAEAAIKDVASLGFHGYESFGNVLEAWEKDGGLSATSMRTDCRSMRRTVRSISPTLPGAVTRSRRSSAGRS